MIPRLNHYRWTPGEKRFAFGRGELARPLQIYIDSESLYDGEALNLLREFAAHPQVDVLSTDGSTPGRVIVGGRDEEHGYTPWDIERSDGTGLRSGVAGNIPQVARAFAEPGQEADAERLMTLALGARDHGCDALVTLNQLLLGGFPPNLVEAANPMPPDAAVSLLGLYLRVRDDFVLEIQPGYRCGFDRGLFYLMLMRDLTPSGWRWFEACVANYEHTQDDRLMMIAQSGMERLERALRARDRLHEQLQLPSTKETAAEAIFYFDVTLLMIGGAFDAAARVAHRVLALGGSEYGISWANRDWLKKLRQKHEPLARLMDKEQPHRDARDLVAQLRNTIHSEALRSITWLEQGHQREQIVVPEPVGTNLETIVDRVASPTLFGVSREHDGRLYLEPGVYIEALLPRVAAALNAIMDATPVETLDGINAAELPTGPPDDVRIFSPPVRERVRMLGGVR